MKHAVLLFAALLLAACSREHAPAWSGYAEGDYVYVAAPIAGTLAVLHVQAGQQVQRGRPLFDLDTQSERAARAEAQARLQAAQAQAANAGKGKRPPEIAVQEAQLASAREQLALAQREFDRRRSLVATGAVSREDFETARTQVEQAQSRVRESAASLQLALLPARPDERAAARAEVEAARQVLRQNQWREDQKLQAAPADALVSDTFFRAGEFVGAGQPVLSLLPPGAIKARFYVGEKELSSFALGQAVRLSCDGCGAPVDARVSFIATQPEYTPPVIYSNAQRNKLVFLLEARPADPKQAARLHPGQPLDVRKP